MRIRPFEYLAASSLEEAVELLSRSGSKARLLAGGTDLVPAMKKGQEQPEKIIGLGAIPGLEGVRLSQGGLSIGALSRLADLAINPLLLQHAPALARAVGLIGSWQIRGVATIGGNICHASPAADSAGPLLALEAEVKALGPQGRRTIPLTEFFTGPGQTCLAGDELVESLELPLAQGRPAQTYLKLMRKKAVDLALVGVAVCLEMDSESQSLSKVALALGGVAATPIRVPEAELLLLGKSPAKALSLASEASRLAANGCRPITDVRASAAYRKQMVKVFVRRGLTQVLNQLSGQAQAGGAG